MKVHNLGREIDNLHKNVVNVQVKRVIKTTARDDMGSAANSNITDADTEEQNKRRINDFNLELGAKAYRYQMLVSDKYRNTCDKENLIAEWEAYRNRLLDIVEHDSRIPKLGLTPEQYVNLSVKYCKSLYIYTYLIRPWLDKTPHQRYKDKKREWMSHDCSVWQRYGNTHELPSKLGCTAERCVIECPYYYSEGTITDEQVHSWYKDEYENFTEAEIKILDILG
jgi:hypothetical protein